MKCLCLHFHICGVAPSLRTSPEGGHYGGILFRPFHVEGDGNHSLPYVVDHTRCSISALLRETQSMASTSRWDVGDKEVPKIQQLLLHLTFRFDIKYCPPKPNPSLRPTPRRGPFGSPGKRLPTEPDRAFSGRFPWCSRVRP